MRFSVDGWDPSYGASLELEEQLQESTATRRGRRGVAREQVAANRRHDRRPASRGAPLRRRRAPHRGPRLDRRRRHGSLRDGRRRRQPAADATAALCASYAAGVVCCSPAGAHLVTAEMRRGLFSVAPHASDIRHPGRPVPGALHREAGRQARPLMARFPRHCSAGWPRLRWSTAAAARASRADGTMAVSRRRRRPADHRRAAARPPAPARARSATSSRTTALTCRRSSTPSWGRSRRASAPRCSSWGPAGTGTAGTCACPARRARRGPGLCASNARPTCPFRGDPARGLSQAAWAGSRQPRTRTPAPRRTFTRSAASSASCAIASAIRACSTAPSARPPSASDT